MASCSLFNLFSAFLALKPAWQALKGEKGKGEFGRARKKVKERLRGRHCFLRFSRSDSERENSDWSELIKCQSST